jgi:sortase A
MATVAVLLIVVVLLANGPLADAWYQARQQHLAADFTAHRASAHKGQASAVLQIPVLSVNCTVAEGDGPSELRAGPGHRPSSPRPGERGNSVILGHDKGWGGPFAKLSRLNKNDQIVVKTRTGRPTVFVVISVARTLGDDRRPFAPSTDYRLTLVTGSGGTFSHDRLVVTAVSGDPGKLSAPDDRTSAGTPSESLLNATVGMMVLAMLAAGAAVGVLRGRYKTATVAVVAVPLALAGLVALLLELDLLLPPLR